MSESVLVHAEGADFYVELAEAGGPQTVALDDVFSFDGVRDAVTAICGELAKAWQAVKPAEATVEFGLNVAARSGKLTGLMVQGGGEASLKITLTWKNG